MQSSQLPTRLQLPFGNSAGASYIRTIPTPSQIATNPGAASLTDGFPPATFSPTGAPDGRDFNGILNMMSAWSWWQAAGGSVPWDSAFSAAIGGYPKGAFVASATTFGLYWVSSVENNTSNPDTGGAGWTAFTFLGQGLVHYGAASGVNTLNTALLPPLSSLVDGTLIEITPASTNTAAVTLNPDSLGAKNVVNRDGTALPANSLLAGQPALLMALGGSLMLMTPPISIAPGVITPKVYAWGNVDNTSGTPVLANGSGVSSMSSVNNGNRVNVTINLTNAMPDTNFTLVFSIASYNSGENSETIQEAWGARTTNSLAITMTAPTLGAVFTKFSFMVYHT